MIDISVWLNIHAQVEVLEGLSLKTKILSLGNDIGEVWLPGFRWYISILWLWTIAWTTCNWYHGAGDPKLKRPPANKGGFFLANTWHLNSHLMFLCSYFRLLLWVFWDLDILPAIVSFGGSIFHGRGKNFLEVGNLPVCLGTQYVDQADRLLPLC